MEHLTPATRGAYEAQQLARVSKFAYCKTGYQDAADSLALIRRDRAHRQVSGPLGPIICLGVRNGREVDLFRIVSRGSPVHRLMVRLCERRYRGRTSWCPLLEAVGRDDYRSLRQTSCIGVELSPRVQRSDVWVGSFDALPAGWAGQFGVVFSNAFDHAYEPWATAAAWWALVRDGGYLILDFPQRQEASPIGPVGRLALADVMALFPGELVAYHDRGSAMGYSRFLFRKPSVTDCPR